MIGLSSVPWIQFGPLCIHKVSVPIPQAKHNKSKKNKQPFTYKSTA
jgi:hypothetical protein